MAQRLKRLPAMQGADISEIENRKTIEKSPHSQFYHSLCGSSVVTLLRGPRGEELKVSFQMTEALVNVFTKTS